MVCIITIKECDSVLTLGVCPLTFPARAREPWTFPPRRGTVRSMVRFSRAPSVYSSSRGEPEQKRLSWNKGELQVDYTMD